MKHNSTYDLPEIRLNRNSRALKSMVENPASLVRQFSKNNFTKIEYLCSSRDFSGSHFVKKRFVNFDQDAQDEYFSNRQSLKLPSITPRSRNNMKFVPFKY